MRIFDLSRGWPPDQTLYSHQWGGHPQPVGVKPLNPGKSNTENIYRVSNSTSNKLPTS